MWSPKTVGAPALGNATSRSVFPTLNEFLHLSYTPKPLRTSFGPPSVVGRPGVKHPQSRGLLWRALEGPLQRQGARPPLVVGDKWFHVTPLGRPPYDDSLVQSLVSTQPEGPPAGFRSTGPFCGWQKRGYFSLPGPLKLGDVVKLPLLQRNSSEQIAQIWLSHFLTKPHRHADILTGAQHDALETNARNASMFIVPLPKGSGAFETLLAQFQRNCCLITSLEQYKRNPTSASPLMTLAFYAELKPTHNLVLVKADIVSPSVMGASEAAHVTRVLVESYTDVNRFQWVKEFNMSPNEFSFDQFKEANPDFFAFPLPERQQVKRQQETDTMLWLA